MEQYDSENSLSTVVLNNETYHLHTEPANRIYTLNDEGFSTWITSPEQLPVCVHGTYKHALNRILKEGLHVKANNHILFATSSTGIPTTSQVLIHLDVKKALEANMKLYLSMNKIFTSGIDGTIPPDYFAKVEVIRLLPEQSILHRGRATLVLDINGTLLSQVPVRQASPETLQAGVRLGKSIVMKRPHADAFLGQMSEMFEVVAFTSREKYFADVLLDILDPEGTVFVHRLYMSSCEDRGVKKLVKLGRPMERVMIVDDTYKKCVHNIENWIPITKFKRSLEDRELLELVPFFVEVAGMEDVRPAIRKWFGSLVDRETSKRQQVRLL